MSAVLTRRGFVTKSGVSLVGSYLLLDSLAGATARAAVGELGKKAGDTVVVRFNAAALEAIRETHPGPPIVARSLAVLHTCMYDAWAAYDKRASGVHFRKSLLSRDVRGSKKKAAEEAMSYAAHSALVDLFPQPEQVAQFDALLRALGLDPSLTDANLASPSGVGRSAAAAVLDFRHADGSNQSGGYADTSGYRPVNDPDHIVDPNRWQPLRVSDGHGGTVVQRFIAPHWGGVAPFALTSGSQFRPTRGPVTVDQPRYREQAQEVLDYTANLDDRQKTIAEYWADGPSSELPPGHWCLFAQFVSRRDRHSVEEDVKMFFAMTNAIHDAGVACWDAKRAFDYVRPVTAIHYLFGDEPVRTWGGRTIPGREWRPYQAVTVVTPPFAEYFSGHSSFSAAGAEVLERFTGSDRFGGSDTLPAGGSRVEPGVVPARDLTLSWATFSDAADEAGISRRYGGIHFEQGDLDGRSVGRRIGSQAWDLAQAHFNGDA